jgi:hypothetical protein
MLLAAAIAITGVALFAVLRRCSIRLCFSSRFFRSRRPICAATHETRDRVHATATCAMFGGTQCVRFPIRAFQAEVARTHKRFRRARCDAVASPPGLFAPASIHANHEPGALPLHPHDARRHDPRADDGRIAKLEDALKKDEDAGASGHPAPSRATTSPKSTKNKQLLACASRRSRAACLAP